MKKYPDGLPPPIRDDYEFTPTNRIERTPMDSGRARQRIKFENVPTQVSVTFFFTEPQTTLFDAWADQVAGVDWFEFPIWTPLRYADEQVKFVESPKGPIPIHGSGRWMYTAQLEVRFKPQAPNGYAEFAPDYILLADLLDLAINKEKPRS